MMLIGALMAGISFLIWYEPYENIKFRMRAESCLYKPLFEMEDME